MAAAPPHGLPAKVVPIPPNQTLFVSNLPSKMQKTDLQTALYLNFSTYGPVLDVNAMRGKMRGQAHVVFRDIQASTQALRSLDGTNFFGQNMRITYAKGKSHVISKLDGTFKTPSTTANVEVTDLQQSIFNAPIPGSSTTAPAATIQGQPAKAATGTDQVMEDADASAARGQKRVRDEEEEEEEEEDSDVAMEEDSDDE